MKSKDGDDVRWFCVRCFADDHGGSWGDGTHPSAGHCANCGAGESLVAIPPWAVASIREQASWVGKRYYPHEEDRATTRELRVLRCKLDPFSCPGRTVQRWIDLAGAHLMVMQRMPGDRSVSMFPDDPSWSDEAALAWAVTRLPYYTGGSSWRTRVVTTARVPISLRCSHGQRASTSMRCLPR